MRAFNFLKYIFFFVVSGNPFDVKLRVWITTVSKPKNRKINMTWRLQIEIVRWSIFDIWQKSVSTDSFISSQNSYKSFCAWFCGFYGLHVTESIRRMELKLLLSDITTVESSKIICIYVTGVKFDGHNLHCFHYSMLYWCIALNDHTQNNQIKRLC